MVSSSPPKPPQLSLPLPRRMRQLPRDPRGYPIPWMVFRDKDGRAHFTINDEAKRTFALLDELCPICGQKLMATRWFVGGPRSAFDQGGVYSDPPMHGECMRYALQVCPYLAAPNYSGRIDARTLKKPEPMRLLWDVTQIADRPALFVAVLAKGQELRRPQFYVQPTRPYLRVEYWRYGWRLSEAEGGRIAAEIVASPLPRLKPVRLLGRS